MNFPTEKIISQAEKALDEQARANEIFEQKQAVIGNIDEAMDVIGNPGVTIPSYAEGDGEVMDIEVYGIGDGSFRGKHTLNIRAGLERTSGECVNRQQAYRVSRRIPNSDTMFSLPARYAIEVADPESEDGFKPIALVDGRAESSRHLNGWDFGIEGRLQTEQLDSLTETGLYVDSRSQHLIDEVHVILGLAIASQKNAEQAHAGETALKAA